MKRIVSLLLTLAMILAIMPTVLAAGVTELELWTLFSGEDNVTINQIVDNFNASQNEYHLNHIAIDYENLMAKLALAIGDDSTCPHMIVTYASDIAYMVDAERIQPMDQIFAAYPEFDFSLDRYNPACKVLNMYKGDRYAVTLDFPSEGCYVNLELANQYCPEVLEDNILTWAEVMEVGAKLEADGEDDIAVLVSEWAQNDIVTAYLLYNRNWSDEAGLELTMDREALINGVKLWKDAYEAGYLWEEGDDPVGLFAEGNAIFYNAGNWCMNAVKNYGFDFSFIASTQLDTDHQLLMGDAHSFMSPNRSYTAEELRGLGMWMAYFYEHSLDWAQAGSLIAASEPRASAEFDALPQAYVANNYEPYFPVYKYNSIVNGVINGFDWQPVYGYISLEDYADAVIKQITDTCSAE